MWAAAGGAAVAAGPVPGGLLIVGLGWRSLFLVNLVIGAVGVALFGTLVAGDSLPGLRLSLAIASSMLVLGALTAARWAPRRG